MIGAFLLSVSLLGRCPDSYHLRWEALRVGLPPRRVEAIARTESDCNLNPHLRGHYCGMQTQEVPAGHPLPAPPVRGAPAYGRDCEVGRFQIKPSTARRRCPGLNIWTYRGNVACGLRMLSEDTARHGLTEATMRQNGSGPATLGYLYRVLKNEERLLP